MFKSLLTKNTQISLWNWSSQQQLREKRLG